MIPPSCLQVYKLNVLMAIVDFRVCNFIAENAEIGLQVSDSKSKKSMYFVKARFSISKIWFTCRENVRNANNDYNCHTQTFLHRFDFSGIIGTEVTEVTIHTVRMRALLLTYIPLLLHMPLLCSHSLLESFCRRSNAISMFLKERRNRKRAQVNKCLWF